MNDFLTGESLYKRTKGLLFSGLGGKARENNFVGIACDHAANMISSKVLVQPID